MAQVAALIWLRFRLLLRRSGSSALSAVAQGVTFLFMMVGALAAYLVCLALFRGLPREMAAEVLQVALAAVWAVWIVSPLVGVSFSDSADLSKLLLYPMSPRRMAAGVLLGDLASSPVAFTVLLAVPVGWTRAPGHAPIAVLAVLLLAVHVVALVESLRIALWDLLRSRRTRDWLILLSPLVGIALYAGYMLAFRGAMLRGPAVWLTLRPSHYLRFLPSGLAAGAVTNASDGRYLPSLAYLVLLALLAAATVAVMARLVRRVQAGEPQAGSRPARERPRRRRRIRPWPALPVARGVATVARKELLMLRRDPHLKTLVVQATLFPLVWVLLMGVWSPAGPGGVHAGAGVFLAAIGMMLFGSFMLCANVFGLEGDAVSTLFLFPMPRRALLAGKNLALWTALMTLYAPALVLLAALSRQWALLPLALVGAGGVLLLSLGIGNFLSVYAPYRPPARRQNPFAARQGPGCIKFLLLLAGWAVTVVAAIPLAAACVLPWALHGPVWYWLTLPAAVGYCWWAYRTLLDQAARRVQAREPEIIEAVGPAARE